MSQARSVGDKNYDFLVGSECPSFTISDKLAKKIHRRAKLREKAMDAIKVHADSTLPSEGNTNLIDVLINYIKALEE